MSMSSSLNPAALDQAADWLMLLNDSAATDADRVACKRWQDASPDNARAWARAELLMNRLGSLPPELAMPVLDRPASRHRRHAIAKLAGLLAALPAAWLGWRVVGQQGWTADHRTATGERRVITLADGSKITLNTATAIDVSYDDRQRLVRLRSGEIFVETARDTSPVRRPFYVDTAEGRLEALGTRFSVRQDDGKTRLAVFESAVRIAPRKLSSAQFRIVQAGQKSSFTAFQIDDESPTARSDDAWTRGMLLVDKMPMAEFAAELARYRSGVVHCDPAIAGLLVSGTFPLDDPERILTMLVSTYPVNAVQRFSGYWVTFVPRG